jgi:hypothetical protein
VYARIRRRSGTAWLEQLGVTFGCGAVVNRDVDTVVFPQ